MLRGLKRLLGFSGNNHDGGGDSSSDMMSCEEVRSSIYEYIDKELDSETAAGVKRHLDACPECYPLAKFETRFIESIQRVTEESQASPDLQQRILDALAKEPTEE
jgi:anti-sigma factor (TIGR02949 family)